MVHRPMRLTRARHQCLLLKPKGQSRHQACLLDHPHHRREQVLRRVEDRVGGVQGARSCVSGTVQAKGVIDRVSQFVVGLLFESGIATR